MNPTVDPVYQAISAAHWYALSGLIVSFLLAALRAKSALLQKLAAWQQYAIGLGVAGGGAFVTAQASGHPLGYAMTAVVVAVFSAATGLLPGVGHAGAVKKAAALLLFVGIAGSVSACATLKPIVHSLNDAASIECAAWASGKLNVPIDSKSVADFCAIQSNLDPFIALVTSQQRAGKAGAAPGPVGCGK